MLPSRVKPGKSRQIAANEKAGFRAFRIQAPALAVAFEARSDIVIFDFVDPVGAGRDRFPAGRDTKLKRLKQAPEIGA